MTPALQQNINRFRLAIAIINKKATHALSETLQAVLFFGGLAAIAYGAWMIYRPAGVIVGGLCGIWTAFLREK